MKGLIVSLIGVFLSLQSNAQVPSDCSVPWILRDEYEMDVVGLAFNRMYDIESQDTSLIEIPTAYRDTIWDGLAALFNADSLPERDSVFDIYCIHNHGYYTFFGYYISLGIDTSYDWTDAWMNNIMETGYTELDNLLAQYGFSIWGNVLPNWFYIDFVTEQIINTSALCDSLIKFEGITFAQPAPKGGDGNFIKYRKIGNEQFFDFSIGWGDCLAGCVNRYIWKFKVYYNECMVEYLGNEAYIWETIFPDPPNCYITEIEEIEHDSEINVFPNPTCKSIKIDHPGIQRIEIYNTQGQLMDNADEFQLNELDLSNYNQGIYYIKIQKGNQIITKKIIKI